VCVLDSSVTGSSLLECPVCHEGRILVIEILPPR
jgi:hypothetical protein